MLLLIFRLGIACVVLLLCYRTDVSLELPATYQDCCFVSLISRFQWKVQCLFCILCFLKVFDGLCIMTWTSMVCVSWLYWDTYCLGQNWICLYSYMFFREFTNLNALVCGGFSVSFSFSMLNIIWHCGWSGYREVSANWSVFGVSLLLSH